MYSRWLAELETAVTAFLTQGTDDRTSGQIAVNAATNTLIVTDVARVLDRVDGLLQQLDKETPQVAIAAKDGILTYDEAVRRSLGRLEAGQVETAWTDALASTQGDVPPVTVDSNS